TAPSQPQNFMIYDISNPNNNDFKEFMSWQIYTSTTTAQFSNYKLYRSVDGINYSLLSAITDINQNYYTDTAVASTTTYYYQLNITDSDNDISSYSVPQNDLPDGQGGSDFTAPVISSVSAAEVQATWARITWTTDELSNSKVEFSTQSAGNYASTTTSISYVTSHEIFISDLAPNTEYVFRVKSTDVMSNEGSAPGGSFLTLGGPIISDVTTESVSDQGAVIFWNTNKDSDSYVIYSTNASLSGSSEIGNPAMVGSPYQHRVTLSGLTPRTTYYYYVKSTDSDNNISLDKNDGNYYSFATTYDTKPPVISNISTPVKTSSAIVIIWQTDELANSQVEYGRTSGIYTDFPALDSVLSINHAYTLTSLSESATYYYRVKSADANANQAISLEQTATTTSAREIVIQQVGGGGGIAVEKDTTAPVISNIQVLNIAAFEATISFSTNESVVGFALYGKGTTYGNTAGSSEFMTSHSIKLSGLKLGTEYHYKVTAVDRSGNTSISEDKTFSTKFAAEALEELMTLENAEQFQEDLEGMIESVMPSLVPPVISQVEVSDVTESSATVSWRSNVPAYGTLAYAAEKDYQSYNVELSQVEKKTREHKIELTGLSPATIYHIQARSFVFPGVVGKSKDITFSTKASKVKPEISKLGNTELEVRWVTEKETSSFAEYTNLITKKVYRVGDSTRVRTHNLKLENLIPDTPYEIRTFGYDENNILVEGDPLKIRTKKDTVAPGISAIRIDNALLPGRTDKLQSVISWKTDEPANSLVYFEEGVGISEELANTAGYENEYTTDHIVILTNLKPATVYRIRVASADESDNLTKSPIRTILTPRSPESVFDVIIRNFQDTFGFLKKLQ
ncbi:MAG: fibronectin type III domain-containing protein, partial [Candidatus Terrybacteria bacterium]|nr:fibronectin type III domain-containing protein [Candidatus Terrybacteria bacterium]